MTAPRFLLRPAVVCAALLCSPIAHGSASDATRELTRKASRFSPEIQRFANKALRPIGRGRTQILGADPVEGPYQGSSEVTTSSVKTWLHNQRGTRRFELGGWHDGRFLSRTLEIDGNTASAYEFVMKRKARSQRGSFDAETEERRVVAKWVKERRLPFGMRLVETTRSDEQVHLTDGRKQSLTSRSTVEQLHIGRWVLTLHRSSSVK